jgi:hypothetical protein
MSHENDVSAILQYVQVPTLKIGLIIRSAS